MTESTMTESKSTVLAYLDALGERDIDRVRALLAESAEYHVAGSHPLSGVWAGRDAILNEFMLPMARLFDPNEPYSVDVRTVVAEGEHVVIECLTTGTTTTGRGYRNPIVAIFTVRENCVQKVAEYFDTELFARTLFG
ncbi:MAG: nuclear transport factor 2 family protein [Pseudonocardiaceae bacterium]